MWVGGDYELTWLSPPAGSVYDARFAPACASLGRGAVRRTTDEGEPVEIGGLPFGLVGAKFQALLVIGTPHEDRGSVLAKLNGAAPDRLPDPCTGAPDKYGR